MPTINKDRLPELRELLHGHNIDINRVMLRNLDETGYDYVKEYRDGRPMFENGQFKLATERLEWPHGVWAKVAELAYGVPPKDVSVVGTKKPTNPGPRGKEKTAPKKKAD